VSSFIQVLIPILILISIPAYIRLLKYRKDLNFFTAIFKTWGAMLPPVGGETYNRLDSRLEQMDYTMKNAHAKRLGWGKRCTFYYLTADKTVIHYSPADDDFEVMTPDSWKGGK
jgi:hypothetical protein